MGAAAKRAAQEAMTMSADRALIAVACCDGALMVDDPAVLPWMQIHFSPAAAALVPRATLLVALQQFGFDIA